MAKRRISGVFTPSLVSLFVASVLPSHSLASVFQASAISSICYGSLMSSYYNSVTCLQLFEIVDNLLILICVLNNPATNQFFLILKSPI